MKCTSAIRQMAYEAVPDAQDEYLQMGATTAQIEVVMAIGLGIGDAGPSIEEQAI
ncbi:hypothetical protein Tco_1383024, partial [Tanacetum coccineum]